MSSAAIVAEAVIDIERLCYGGAGFGRIDGKACFVPLTAPGDRARVRVVKEKRSFAEAEMVELLEPSPLRTSPPCPYFGVCGGCDWQHLPYEEQLKQKGEIFADTLGRIGKVQRELVLPVSPSPDCYGYRSRIQLKLARKAGAPMLGFFKRGSHDVVDLASGCALAAPVLNRLLAEIRGLLPRLPQLEGIPQVDLAMGDDGDAIAVFHFRGKDPASLVDRLLAARPELPSATGAYVKCGEKGEMQYVFGVDSLSYGVPAGLFPGSRQMRLRFSRGGFSQVNYRQNLELIRTVGEWGGLQGGARVLDLYCGNGNISVPVAPLVREVVGVEGYAPSIADAVANAEANGVANASYQVGDAALSVRRLLKRKEKFDLVILDPPRAGAEAAGDLALLAPERIVYVSCDPSTLARDLAQLCGAGYRVARSKPVDMFPQTYHVESVTELIRR